MVSPTRRKEAVNHLQTAFKVSERRACKVVKQPRSTQRYERKQPTVDQTLVQAIRRIAEEEPRAGYRTVTKFLRREVMKINVKRVHRVWKKEGLKVPTKPPQKRPRGSSKGSSQKLRVERLNQVWRYDFIFDQI